MHMCILCVCVCVCVVPGGTNGKEPRCQCRRIKRSRFHPWVGKMTWRRAWQLAPVLSQNDGWKCWVIPKMQVKNAESSQRCSLSLTFHTMSRYYKKIRKDRPLLGVVIREHPFPRLVWSSPCCSCSCNRNRHSWVSYDSWCFDFYTESQVGLDRARVKSTCRVAG